MQCDNCSCALQGLELGGPLQALSRICKYITYWVKEHIWLVFKAWNIYVLSSQTFYEDRCSMSNFNDFTCVKKCFINLLNKWCWILHGCESKGKLFLLHASWTWAPMKRWA
jgi:hypothetical protein